MEYAIWTLSLFWWYNSKSAVNPEQLLYNLDPTAMKDNKNPDPTAVKISTNPGDKGCQTPNISFSPHILH